MISSFRALWLASGRAAFQRRVAPTKNTCHSDEGGISPVREYLVAGAEIPRKLRMTPVRHADLDHALDAEPEDAMDSKRFDNIGRALATRGSRRGALGALAGGLLAALVPTAAGGKKRRGKKKGKRLNQCAERCGGQCRLRCPDVMTRNESTCECECPDEMTKCGQICVGQDRCCPGEKTCGGGCIREQECCPLTEKECPNAVCVPRTACCPIIETACGDRCCILPEECCNGTCGDSLGGVCTTDGFCQWTEGQACCAESTQNCSDHPCCLFSAGEACCPWFRADGTFESTCCRGAPLQCAIGGGCPAGTEYKIECDKCCTRGTTGCSNCSGVVAGRG